MDRVTYAVDGMTCEHCVRAVTEEVARIDGVAAVAVDLASGAVTITSSRPVDPAAVRDAVTEAGYQLAAD
jgi:copper ion binding protein